jgi:FkbM family methyltransferase
MSTESAEDRPQPGNSSAAAEPELAMAYCGEFAMVYRRHTADETVLFRESFNRDMYLRAFPHFVPSRSHVYIHIGAHIGGFAVMAAARVRHVYAIEASRRSFDLLAANVHLNHLANVTASHLAIADRPGVLTLHESPSGTWGNSLTARGAVGSEQVPAATLAQYFEQNAIDRCDLLICNAEGAEFLIFPDAGEVLARIERLAVMYHEDLSPGHRVQELLDAFYGAGFQARIAVVQDAHRGGIIASRPR